MFQTINLRHEDDIMRLLVICSMFLNGCGSYDPLQIFRDEITSYGFIPFSMPLESAKTGTLIGGAPNHMQLIAPWQTCFPDILGDTPTNLRKTDASSLPNKRRSFEFSGEARLALFDILNLGNPVLQAGAQFHTLSQIQLEFSKPQREYLDSVMLTDYYRTNKVPQGCAEYLEHVGFIIEGIKVEQMKFAFYDAHSNLIQLSAENIEDIVDISVDIRWRIDNNYTLIIDSPKYIGYRLGRLKASDRGLALYRAATVRDNKYIFESIDIFQPATRRLEPRFVPPFMLPHAPKHPIDPYATYR